MRKNYHLEDFNKEFRKGAKTRPTEVKMVLRNYPSSTYSKEIKMKFGNLGIVLNRSDEQGNYAMFKEETSCHQHYPYIEAAKYIDSYKECFSDTDTIFVVNKKNQTRLKEDLLYTENWVYVHQKYNAVTRWFLNSASAGGYNSGGILTDLNPDQFNYQYVSLVFPVGSKMKSVYEKLEIFAESLFEMKESEEYSNFEIKPDDNTWETSLIYKNISMKTKMKIEKGLIAFEIMNYQNPEEVEIRKEIDFEDLESVNFDDFVLAIHRYAESKKIAFLLNPSVDIILDKIQKIVDEKKAEQDKRYSSYSSSISKEIIDREGFEKLIKDNFKVTELLPRLDELRYSVKNLYNVKTTILNFEGKIFLINKITDLGNFSLVENEEDITRYIEKKRDALIAANIQKIKRDSSDAMNELKNLLKEKNE